MTALALVHTISINNVRLDSAHQMYQAVCVCGFASNWARSKTTATKAGNRHTGEPELAIWQTCPCPAWCSDREAGGHWDGQPKEQRDHRSQWFTMDRPRLTAVLDGRHWRHRRTGVQLRQRANPDIDSPVFLYVGTENDDGVFNEKPDLLTYQTVLTVSEALDFAELVRRAALLAFGS